MIIGLDYDGTITENRSFWLAFYYLARATGVEILVVTMRRESEPVTDFPAMVYYTDRKAKKPFMDKLGINVNVWIDDNPAWVYQDSY